MNNEDLQVCCVHHSDSCQDIHASMQRIGVVSQANEKSDIIPGEYEGMCGGGNFMILLLVLLILLFMFGSGEMEIYTFRSICRRI